MKIFSKIITKILIVMFTISGLLGNYQTFATTELSFTETSNNNWGSGFCYGFTAENTGTDDITNWVIGVNIDGGVNNGWGANFSAIGGGDYELISSSSEKDSLSPGEKVDIGFCGNAPGIITNIHLKSFTPVSGVVLQDYTVAINVLQVDVTTNSSWGSGYCRNVLLSNISNNTINDWQVNFELDQALTSSSSANYTQNGVYYTITPLSWNKELPVGATTTVSFCTSGVNIDNSWSIGTLSVGNNDGEDTSDITPPVISSTYPTSEQMLANGNFDFIFEYSDEETGSGIDISSDLIKLYQWDGYNWGSDIASTYINSQTKIITSTGAFYNATNLIGGKYKVNFSISDLEENLTSTGVVFHIATGSVDTTAPTIGINSHTNNQLYPNSDFDLEFTYSDNQSGVDTNTLDFEIQKWEGSFYSADISHTYLNSTGTVINPTNASFPINKLGYGKYKILYSIDDNDGNNQSNELILYIDEPQFTINKKELDLGILSPGVEHFSNDTFAITVETLGAGFDIYVNKESAFLYESIEITDWNGLHGFGYDVLPYTNNINLIQKNQVIGSEIKSINTNGEKNTYIYYIKFAAKIDELQAAGLYNAFISFGIAFQYE